MERLDCLFSLFKGRGEINEIVFREILNLIDQGWECDREFRESGILFCAGGGGDKGA